MHNSSVGKYRRMQTAETNSIKLTSGRPARVPSFFAFSGAFALEPSPKQRGAAQGGRKAAAPRKSVAAGNAVEMKDGFD